MFNFRNMAPLVSRAIQSMGNKQSPSPPVARVAQMAAKAPSSSNPIPPGFSTMGQRMGPILSQVAKSAAGRPRFKSGGKSKKSSNW